MPAFAKVGVGILVIDFQGNICMSSDRFQNLQFKTSFNSLRASISELHGPADTFDSLSDSPAMTKSIFFLDFINLPMDS
jgi:hypothetical protein